MAKITKLCPHCGSDDIGVQATASWDALGQYWKLGSLEEIDCFCRACDRDEFEPLSAEQGEEKEFFAAHKAGWRHGGDNGGFWYDGKEFDSWKEAASADDSETYGSPKEVCEAHGLLDTSPA